MSVEDFGKHYWHKPIRRIRPDDPFEANFSGYGGPELMFSTVENTEAFYVHGKVGLGGWALSPDKVTEYTGMPISGDEIARYRCWRETAERIYYRDIELPAPEQLCLF